MAGKKTRAVIKTGPAPERKQRGRVDRSVMFPVPPPASDVPVDYAAWLADLKARIRQERLRVVLAGNAVMVLLYTGTSDAASWTNKPTRAGGVASLTAWRPTCVTHSRR